MLDIPKPSVGRECSEHTCTARFTSYWGDHIEEYYITPYLRELLTVAMPDWHRCTYCSALMAYNYLLQYHLLSKSYCHWTCSSPAIHASTTHDTSLHTGESESVKHTCMLQSGSVPPWRCISSGDHNMRHRRTPSGQTCFHWSERDQQGTCTCKHVHMDSADSLDTYICRQL